MLAMLAGVATLTARQPASVTAERADKADYYFLEAMRQAAMDHDDAAMMMLRRAHQLNPSATDVGALYGARLITLGGYDSTMLASGVQLLDRHFTANPSDVYVGLNLSMIYHRFGHTSRARRIWAALDSAHPNEAAVVWQRAMFEAQAGDTLTALQLMDRVETLSPGTPNVFMATCRLLGLRGDTAAIVSRAADFIGRRPHDANVHVIVASVYDVLGLRDSASAHIARALELDPGNGAAYREMVMSHRMAGDPERYRTELLQALTLDDLDYESKRGLLEDYIATDTVDDPALTEQLLGVMLEQYPREESLRQICFANEYTQGHYFNAAEQLAVVADMHPDNAEIFHSAMRLYVTADSLRQGLEMGLKGLRYHPDDPDLTYTLGGVYLLNEDHDNALAYMRRAAELRADNPANLSEVYCSIGDVLQHLDQPDSVAAAYRRSLHYNPHNLLPLNNYAYYIVSRPRQLTPAEIELADSMVTVAVTARPDVAIYLDTKAWVEFRAGRYEEARVYIDDALERSADHPQAELFDHAGDIYYHLGLRSEAVQFWTRALELDPDSELIARKVKRKTYFSE